ncbi:gamma-glutamylcyclotransferase family protein [uncultured Selenomonas sp.]|uniref:gamma-glutamylcyclotransferase family protein n=1 Tax=uncultured Selenomonas sp. TaxID=159275 RepID=UPI0028D588C4|nr:gamma-glutamylcyclotransferase family protein [uncultured Selenomonas sp.]
MRRLYAAYGSNLSIAAMRTRCPEAQIIGTAVLADTALAYRGRPPQVFLTLLPQAGASVPIGIWSVTARDEDALDRYEDYPALYRKETVLVRLTERGTGAERDAAVFLYRMVDGMPPGTPDAAYVDVCRAGFRDFGFDERLLAPPQG